MTRNAPASFLALAVLVGATGCAGGSVDGSIEGTTRTVAPTSAPSSAAGATEVADPAASAPPPFETGTDSIDGAYGSGNGLGLTGVRTGPATTASCSTSTARGAPAST